MSSEKKAKKAHMEKRSMKIVKEPAQVWNKDCIQADAEVSKSEGK